MLSFTGNAVVCSRRLSSLSFLLFVCKSCFNLSLIDADVVDATFKMIVFSSAHSAYVAVCGQTKTHLSDRGRPANLDLGHIPPLASPPP